MRAKAGTFTAETSAANDSVISGLGFTPKVVFCWATIATADGYVADVGASFGFAIGSAASQNRCQGWSSDDAISTDNLATAYRDSLIGIPNVGGSAMLWEGGLKTLDSDGFTIDWLTVQGTGCKVNYLALGGSDLTNLEIGDFVMNSTTGNQSVTTGFQPDFLMLIGGVFGTGTAAEIPEINAHLSGGIGAAQSATARWAMALGGRDGDMASTSNRGKNQRTDSVALGLLPDMGFPTEDSRADFVSFNAAPSFTINVVNAPIPTQDVFSYLALKGGSYAVGALNKTTSAAPVSQDVTAPGFEPAGVLLLSFNAAATTSIIATPELSIGGASDPEEAAVWVQDINATDPTEANSSQIASKAIRLAEGPSTTKSEADLAMLSNGFRLSWTTNDTAVADEICYVAFGPAEGVVNNLDAGTGSYAVTGSAATFTVSRVLSATSGIYALAGSVATLPVARLLSASSGAYVVVGSAATFTATRTLTAAAGSYVVAGSAAGMALGRVLSAGTGSYVLTGSAATLTRALTMTASGGSYVVSGSGATKGWTLFAATGVYGVTGSAVTFNRALIRGAAGGAYLVGGSAVVFSSGEILIAGPGSYGLTGSGAGFVVGRVLAAATGSYGVVGSAASLTKALTLTGGSGAYVIVGSGSVVVTGPLLDVAMGAYTLTGSAAEFFVAEGDPHVHDWTELPKIVPENIASVALEVLTPSSIVSVAEESLVPSSGAFDGDHDWTL